MKAEPHADAPTQWWPSTSLLNRPARGSRTRAYQHFWGTDQSAEHPDVWLRPTLAGSCSASGVRLSGLMVGPRRSAEIAGQTIKAFMPSKVVGMSTSPRPVSGRNLLSLVRSCPGNYMVYGQGQDGSGGVSPDLSALSKPIRVIQPVKVYLQEGAFPPPLVLREVPTFEVEVQFVDPRGQPAAGSPAKVWGIDPLERARPGQSLFAHSTVGGGLASADQRPRTSRHRRPHRLGHAGDRPDENGPDRLPSSQRFARSIYPRFRPMKPSPTRPA